MMDEIFTSITSVNKISIIFIFREQNIFDEQNKHQIGVRNIFESNNFGQKMVSKISIILVNKIFPNPIRLVNKIFLNQIILNKNGEQNKHHIGEQNISESNHFEQNKVI